MGSASMICPLLVFSESDSESGFGSLSLILATNDCFERHSSVLCQGILWKSHHFLVSFFFFLWPFFSCGLDWFLGDCLLGLSLSYFGCYGFADLTRNESGDIITKCIEISQIFNNITKMYQRCNHKHRYTIIHNFY
jgi:hypothetical protein